MQIINAMSHASESLGGGSARFEETKRHIAGKVLRVTPSQLQRVPQIEAPEIPHVNSTMSGGFLHRPLPRVPTTT